MANVAVDTALTGLSDRDLQDLMIQAMIQNGRHPDFVDYSGEPDFNCEKYQVWFDADAEMIFDAALNELLTRYDDVAFEFPDGQVPDCRGLSKGGE